MLRTSILPILLFVSSCALFRSGPHLSDSNVDTVINSIKMTGEGRGRLSFDQGQQLFSYEAFLKDNKDWLLAVAVPLHGEEVMIFSDIKENKFKESSSNSFEIRLQKEIDAKVKGKGPKGEDYIQAMRSIIKLVLASDLQLKRECYLRETKLYECKTGEDFALVRIDTDKIFIRKNMSQGYFLEFVAENLTDSFFRRTNFHLQSKKPGPLLSLELFWK